MIQSIRALGRFVRQALPDDTVSVVRQLALASDDEDTDDSAERRRYLAVVDLWPERRQLRHELVEVSSPTLRRYLFLNLLNPAG